MPWPDYITHQFELVNKFTTDESDYYGPFNGLLNDLFPVSEYYQVVPQFKRIAGSIDFTVEFRVLNGQDKRDEDTYNYRMTNKKSNL
jgi:hypothetical protein